MIRVFKKLVFRSLCNPIVGFLLTGLFQSKIICLRFFGFKESINVGGSYVSDEVKCMIFWGFYESAELRLLHRHLPPDIPVIELGASIGVVSKFILNRLDVSVKLLAVEPNSYLMDSIHTNTFRHPNKEIINSAVSYSGVNYVYLDVSRNNTESRVISSELSRDSNLRIPAIKLDDLIFDEYTLVCDIEGAEIEILLFGGVALNLCHHLFIELHQVYFNGLDYSIESLDSLIQIKHGFKQIDRIGNAFYYAKE